MTSHIPVHHLIALFTDPDPRSQAERSPKHRPGEDDASPG
ncbi:unnamed protein product [[Actinomadura] parvosata subsp. kistnae]|nr:unnamed protein product [Actinomadura parvosata subsp. kistnae]